VSLQLETLAVILGLVVLVEENSLFDDLINTYVNDDN
jgi:hypothetical protein